MTDQPTLSLNDDCQIPQQGFGIYKIADDDAARAVETVDVGYRLVDTAAIYKEDRRPRRSRRADRPRSVGLLLMRLASSLALIGATGVLAACTSPPPSSSDVPTESVAPAAPMADMREASVESRSLDYPALSGCGVVSAGNWTAHIVEGASPEERILVVAGEAGTNPGVDMAIRLDPDIMESDPVQRRARLVVQHPPGDNIDRLDRYEPSGRLTYRPPLGIVRLECKGVLLASITDPEEG